jgi:hypothetical protein
MSLNPERPKRIASKAPWYLRPFVRFILGRCAECPERLNCLVRLLGGRDTIKSVLPRYDDCRNFRNKKDEIIGISPTLTGVVSKYIAKFLKENCRDCRSLNACSKFALIHVEDIDVRAPPPTLDIKSDLFEGAVRRCIECPDLTACIELKLRTNNLSATRLLLNTIKVRISCVLPK